MSAGPIGTCAARPDLGPVAAMTPVVTAASPNAASCPARTAVQLVQPSSPAASAATRTSPRPTAGGARNATVNQAPPTTAAATNVRSNRSGSPAMTAANASAARITAASGYTIRAGSRWCWASTTHSTAPPVANSHHAASGVPPAAQPASTAATAATTTRRRADTRRGCHHGTPASPSVVSPTVQAASSGLTVSAASTQTIPVAHVMDGPVGSGGGWQPPAAAQDRGGPRRQVLFDVGVVVGHDPFDVGVGLGRVAQGLAGRDEVQQRGVGAAAGQQRDLGGVRGEFGFPDGQVVGGDQVRDVDDHRRVVVVQGGVDQPPVPAGALPVERHTGDQVQRGPQVGDAAFAAGHAAEPEPAEQFRVQQPADDPVRTAAEAGVRRQVVPPSGGVDAEPFAGTVNGVPQFRAAGDVWFAGPQGGAERFHGRAAGPGGQVGDDLGVPGQPPETAELHLQ